MSRSWLLLLVCGASALAQSSSAAPSDLAGRVDLNLLGGFITEQNLRFLLLEVPVNLNRYISVAPAYARIGSSSIGVDQLRGSVLISLPVRRFVFDDRNLLLRSFSSYGDATLYRNRLRVTYPLKLWDKHASVFVSNEVFYDWRLHAWSRNWISTGGSFDLSRALTAQAYYLRQDVRGNSGANTVVCALLVHVSGIARIPGGRRSKLRSSGSRLASML